MKRGVKERLSLTLDAAAHGEILRAIEPYSSRQKTLILIELIRLGLEASSKGHRPGMLPFSGAVPSILLDQPEDRFVAPPAPPQQKIKKPSQPRPEVIHEVAPTSAEITQPTPQPEPKEEFPKPINTDSQPMTEDFNAVKSFLDM